MNVDIPGITEVRGRIYNQTLLGIPVKIMPTFHPAAALYNHSYKSKLEEDFASIKAELEAMVF